MSAPTSRVQLIELCILTHAARRGRSRRALTRETRSLWNYPHSAEQQTAAPLLALVSSPHRHTSKMAFTWDFRYVLYGSLQETPPKSAENPEGVHCFPWKSLCLLGDGTDRSQLASTGRFTRPLRCRPAGACTAVHGGRARRLQVFWRRCFA